MKNDKHVIASVLDREMNRTEFLKLSGAALLGLTGVGQLIKLGSGQKAKKTSAGSGYGSSAYGGKKQA